MRASYSIITFTITQFLPLLTQFHRDFRRFGTLLSGKEFYASS